MTLNRKSKALSVFLTVALLLTLLPTTAWAAAATGSASGTQGYDSIHINLSGSSQFSADEAAVQNTGNWTLTPTGGTQTITSVTRYNNQYVRIVLSAAIQAGQTFTITAAENVFAAETEPFAAPLAVNITVPIPATGTATANTGTKDIAVALTGGSFGNSSAVQEKSFWTLGGASAAGNPIAGITYVDPTHATVTLTNDIGASDTYTLTASQYVFVNAAVAPFASPLSVSIGVCAIGAQGFTSLGAAIASVPIGNVTPVTIRLLQSITQASPVVIDQQKIDFDLNGFDLTIDASGADDAALTAKNGGKVGYSGSGSFRVIGKFAALVTVDDSYGDEITVSYAETTADSAYTIQAYKGDKITVMGDVLSGGKGFYGLWAVLGGQITVEGKVTAYNTGVFATGVNSATGVGSKAIVKNGVTMTSPDGTGVIARNGGKAEITGDITAGKCGVAVDGSSDSSATVAGSVTVTGTSTELIAGVQVGGYGSASVTGNVTVSGAGCTGISANSGTVLIGGSVTSAALGAEAASGGKITVDGSLTAAGSSYVKVGTVIKNVDDYESTSTKAGYREYKNSGNIVWVKTVWPADSALTASGTTDTSTVLSWTAATGALDYCVYKNNAFEGVPAANTRTYTVTGLTPDTDYPFKVQAAYLEGASGTWTKDGPSVTVHTSTAPPATAYTATVVNGIGSGSYAQGAAVSITADAAPGGQTFDKWTSSDGAAFANANSASTTFTMPGKSVTVTATYKDAGGGTPSTPSTPETPTYKAVLQEGAGAETTVPVVVDKAAGTASVDAGSQKLTQGGTVIRVPSIPDVDTYAVGIPVPDLSTTALQGTLTLNTAMGSAIIPSNMLTGVAGITGSKAEISIGRGDKSSLPKDVKAAIGDRPLIQLTLAIDGRQTDWSNPSAPVAVNIPYTPTAEELKNPESIVIWYIDGSGKLNCVQRGHYDPATGAVTFITTHFSGYAVGYNKVSFGDVAAGAWYYDAVSFIGARGITPGTGSGQYSPDAKLTRGEFIVLMMRAYGISPEVNPTHNFSDAGSTYYTGYLAAAKRLGITSGIGNNQYAPGNQITRQEMFTLLYNTLKVIGQLPQGASGKKVLDFSDAGQISDWAREAMDAFVVAGTVGGSNGKLTPTGPTTRAEMAQVLYNLLGK